MLRIVFSQHGTRTESTNHCEVCFRIRTEELWGVLGVADRGMVCDKHSPNSRCRDYRSKLSQPLVLWVGISHSLIRIEPVGHRKMGLVRSDCHVYRSFTILPRILHAWVI